MRAGEDEGQQPKTNPVKDSTDKRLIYHMDKKKQMNDDYYCKGQCGYGPHCSECMKEKYRKWEDSLLKKTNEDECTEEDVR